MSGSSEVGSPFVQIKLSLRGHPKLLKLRRLLQLPHRRDALGIVTDLFLFALEQAWADGDLSCFDDDDLEERLEWDGDRGALIAALQNCGRELETGEAEPGFLVGKRVHDWVPHNKRLIDGRLLRKERRGGPAPSSPSPRRAQGPDPKAKAAELLRKRGVAG